MQGGADVVVQDAAGVVEQLGDGVGQPAVVRVLGLDPHRGQPVPHLVVGPGPEGEQAEEGRGHARPRPARALGAPEAGPPAHQLGQDGQDQEDADGPGQRGQEDQPGGQGEVRTGPRCW